MTVDYTSYLSVEVTDSEDNYKELIFAVDLNMTTAGRPAYISGLPEDCYPAESAEFEVVQVGVDNPKVKTTWTHDEFVEFIGAAIADKLIEDAMVDANENYVDEGRDPDDYRDPFPLEDVGAWTQNTT